jgi:hypothetical protein
VYAYGTITVLAKDEQAARSAAFAEYQEEGMHWTVIEQDEEYPVRINDVTLV